MKKVFLFSVTLLLLCCCIFNIFAEPAIAGSASVLAEEENNEVYTSAPDGIFTLTPAQLLEIFIQESISEAEALYVNRTSTLSLSYKTGISADKIKILCPKDSHELLVYAEEYTVPSEEYGVTVTWRPVSVCLGEQSAVLEKADGEYSYFAKLLPDGGEETVNVTYETEFVFSKDAVNELISMAYIAAVAASDAKAEYDLLLAEFERRKKIHENYILALAEYETKLLPEYNDYLAECERLKNEYEVLKGEYEIYLETEFQSELDKYQEELEEYKIKYAEYQTYINVTKPEYDEKYNAHLAYLDAMDDYKDAKSKYDLYTLNSPKYNKHLEIINMAKTPMTDGRSLYNAIMGDTVTAVLKRQDEIVAAGAPAKLVRQANRATNKLRTLFEAYFGCETDAERYAYYAKYYSDFTEASISLLEALDHFYKMNGGTGIVYTKLVQEEKAKKYVILLSQLYIFATALSDEDVYNYEGTVKFTDSYTWTYSLNLSEHNLGKKYTVTPVSMLEGERYLTDTNAAAPYSEPYPEYIEEPTEPEEVLKPDPIDKVTEPQKPTEPKPLPAPELVLPEEVQEPTEPDFVANPGSAPENPVDEYEERLIAALTAGELESEREEYTEDFTLLRQQSVTGDVTPKNGAVVYFYESRADGAAFTAEFVKQGDTADFGSDRLDYEDEDSFYELVGWSYEDGRAAELSNIGTGHVYLYPEFKAYSKDVYCAVVWNIDGKQVKTYFENNALHDYGKAPEKAEDEDGVYIFDKWDGPYTDSDGNTVYNAVFTLIKHNYKVEWKLGTEVLREESYSNGETPISPFEVGKIIKKTDTHWYVFKGWNKNITPIDGDDAVYEAECELVEYVTITWALGSGQILRTTECEKGTAPEIPEDISTSGALLMRDAKYNYFLIKWNKEEGTPVFSDTVFEAEYEREYIYACADGGADIEENETSLTADISELGINEIPDFSVLAALAVGKDLTVKTALGAFTFSAQTVQKMLDDGAEKIKFEAGAKYSVTVLDSEGGLVDGEKTALYEISAKFALGNPMTPEHGGEVHFVCLNSDGSYTAEEISLLEGSFEIGAVKPNEDYVFMELYDIRLYADGEWIFVQNMAKEGERVEFSLDLPDGKLVDELYYVWRGERYAVSGGVFEMPLGSIELFASSRFIEYNITFELYGGTVVEQSCAWGTVPKPPSAEQRIWVSPDVYIFEGWGAEVAAAFSDAYYTAQYRKGEIYPCGEDGADISYPYGRVVVDFSERASSVIRDFAELAALCGGKTLVVKTKNAEVTLSASAISKMLSDGVKEFAVNAEQNAGDGYSLDIRDESGSEILSEKTDLYEIEAEFRLTEAPAPENGGTVYFAAVNKDGSYDIIAVPPSDGTLKIKDVKSNVSHTYVECFEINIRQDAGEWITVKTQNPQVAAGERVEIIKNLPVGMTVKNMYYVMEDGSDERVAIDGEYFTMPSGDIRIFVSLQPIKFTVSFVLHDGTVLTRLCDWGTVPTPPSVSKGMDSTYIYTFTGWDRELEAAYGDAVYTALYEKTLIEGEEYSEGNFWLLYLITVYRFRKLVAASVISSLASAIAFAVMKIYRKKHSIS